jgi:hypothetical protein
MKYDSIILYLAKSPDNIESTRVCKAAGGHTGGRWRVDKSVLGFYNGVNIIGDVWGKLKYRT